VSSSTPISYEALSKGTPVQDSNGGQFGSVEHVLQVPELDLFDGVVVKTLAGLRFVDRDHIGTMTESLVETDLTPEQASALPEPQGDEVYRADPGQDEGDGLTAHLGRLFRREHWIQQR
jgi:hypothetical protein